MQPLVALPNELLDRRSMFVFDDFPQYTDTQLWTKLAADLGASVANNDGDFGLLTLTTGGTDNNECAVKLTRKLATFTSSEAMYFETRINYQEGNTNCANVFAGIASALSA